MAELVYALVSKTSEGDLMRVQFSLPALYPPEADLLNRYPRPVIKFDELILAIPRDKL